MAFLVAGSFRDAHGDATLANYAELTTPSNLNLFASTIEISLVTAVAGGILGFLLAYAVIAGGLPAPLRDAVMTFCGVASNFAGVPLALAFIFTLGNVGPRHAAARGHVRHRPPAGRLQPLHEARARDRLHLLPAAADGPDHRAGHRRAAARVARGGREHGREPRRSTGAWWRCRSCMPSILGAMILLFANAFGAFATAYQLTGGVIPIVAVQIGAQISGDVLQNQGLGYALAMGMVVVMAVAIVLYVILQRPRGAMAPMAGRDAPRARVVWWLVFVARRELLPHPALRDARVLAAGAAAVRGLHQHAQRPEVRGQPHLLVLRRVRDDRGDASALLLPTAYWVRLKVPRLQPLVELITLLPFVVPAIVLVFGLIRDLQPPAAAVHAYRLGQHRAARRRRTSSSRCRTCTGRSTPACARSTSAR